MNASYNYYPGSPVLTVFSPDTMLEYYACDSRNVFPLGFVPANVESAVVLLCGNPFAYQNKGIHWDPSQRQPLIQDRQFLSWPVKEVSGLERPGIEKEVDPILLRYSFFLT